MPVFRKATCYANIYQITSISDSYRNLPSACIDFQLCISMNIATGVRGCIYVKRICWLLTLHCKTNSKLRIQVIYIFIYLFLLTNSSFRALFNCVCDLSQYVTPLTKVVFWLSLSNGKIRETLCVVTSFHFCVLQILSQ